MTSQESIQVKGLNKRSVAAFVNKAKRLGLSPEQYLSELVRNDLALDRKARSTPLSELFGSGRAVDETELDRLVESARSKHHRRSSSKKQD